MPFAFDIEKATQAVAVLLGEAPPPHRDNYMRLLKLLYLADRRSIALTGQPITGDRVHAMKDGPVLSHVYDLMKGTDSGLSLWSKCIKRAARYEIQMSEDPGRGQLSPLEVEILQAVWRENLEHGESSMVEITHKLPEWEKHKPHDEIKNERIPFTDILEALGMTADSAELLARAREDAHLRRVFAGA